MSNSALNCARESPCVFQPKVAPMDSPMYSCNAKRGSPLHNKWAETCEMNLQRRRPARAKTVMGFARESPPSSIQPADAAMRDIKMSDARVV